MMKRFFCVLLAVICVSALPLTFHADIVMGNDYFNFNKEDNLDKIVKWYDGIGKSFIINSPRGYVVPKENAGSKKGILCGPYDVFVIQNGKQIIIKAVVLYEGKYWGIYPPTHWHYPRFWFLMDDLLIVYDCEDFEEENKDSIYAYIGNAESVLSAKKLVVWQWPGCDSEKKIIEDKEEIIKCDDILFGYKDSEGREWGKSNDAQGWICLSDPENSDIPMFYLAPEPVKWTPDGSSDWTKAPRIWPPAEPLSGLETIIVASAVLVIIIAAGVTTGLGLRAKRKKTIKNNK
ncbi:MAG TPA: hypothetical protein PK854_07505 [Oscillospiraceae bacterium]|nr:hypothetical protein [Oscillospiraceae bacterium]HPS35096.1 hypothetical protein [Oscillospiraceae bacterium]